MTILADGSDAAAPQANGAGYVGGGGADVAPSPAEDLNKTDVTIPIKDEEAGGSSLSVGGEATGTVAKGNSATGGRRDSNGNPERTYKRKMSISEEAEEASSGRLKPPKFLSWLEVPFRVKNSQTGSVLGEATAWGMDAAARGAINQVGSFVGAAVLRLATQDAALNKRCFPQTPTCEFSDNTIYGLKPSSLLTLGSVVVTLSAALLMPIVGSIVDHTRHRKVIGAVTAFLIVAITGAQMVILFIKDSKYKEGMWLKIFETDYYHWFSVYILEIIGGFALIVHHTAVLAYLPDLVTTVENHEEAAHYTARFNVLQFVTQACFTIIVIAVSFFRDFVTIETAQLGLAICFPLSAILMGYAWTFLFRKRPPLIEKPEGTHVVTAGFIQLTRTAKNIAKKYHALRWLMIALLWSPEAGAGVVLSIAVTFLTIEIGMDGTEIGLVAFVLLVCNVPGSFFGRYVMNRINPLNSYRAAMLFFAAMVAGMCATLSGPDKKELAYLWSGLCGIAFGWLYPSQRTLFVTMTPKGQETEMMGVLTFAGQILGWLPPVMFTIMNENGVDMRWGFSLISWFLGLSFVCTLFIGDYKTALEQVASPSEEEEEEHDEDESDVVHKEEKKNNVKNGGMHMEEGLIEAHPESANAQ